MMMMITNTNQVGVATLIVAFVVIQTQLALSVITAALSAITLAYGMVLFLQSDEYKRPTAPGPRPWPILGSLHLMNGYRVGSN